MRSDDVLHSTSGHLAILRAAALLVPGERRAEWLAEWRSELWYASQKCSRELATLLGGRWYITAFCLGSFKDALWLRRNSPQLESRETLHLKSPMQCIAFLGVLAASSTVITFLLWLGNRDSASSADFYYQTHVAFLFVFIFPCCVLPAITSLSLGDFPARSELRAWKGRLRRGIFLSGKVALILLMVCCGLLILACNGVPFIPAPLQITGLLWGYTFALRWALNDQRRRCPVCLRLLTKPVWVGGGSRSFVESNCLGFMCPRGHGLLYVPVNPTSWFSTQRWLCLASSCRGLF